MIEKLKDMPQDSIVIIQKPKNARGYSNQGKFLSGGEVYYKAGYGTIIK